jgi:peptidoglycan/LPS O-acetylase OafA/YrhL
VAEQAVRKHPSWRSRHNQNCWLDSARRFVSIAPMERRIEALDSLRGLAAVAVVAEHLQEATGGQSALGHPAVILFFVLSGFVLARPWVHGRPPPWRGFLIRRVCRLWPPAIVAVAVSAALLLAIGVRSPYLGSNWIQPLDARQLTHCLLLTGQHGVCALDPPLWSLVLEVRLSLVFPLLVLAALRAPVAVGALGLLWAVQTDISAWITERGWPPQLADGWVAGFSLTIHFAGLFIFGILLAAFGPTLRDRMRSGPALIVACVLLALPSDAAQGLGAVLVIQVALTAPLFGRFLLSAPLCWAGRVSYSLYVIHMPIMAAVFYGFGGPLTLPGAALVVAGSAAAAELMYRLVERPSIAAGRWFGGPR